MSNFTEGDRVICIEKNEIRKGTVQKEYIELGIAIVNFDDGATEKVHLEMLAREPEPVKAEENVQDEKPTLKSEVTITPDEFKKITITAGAKILQEQGLEHITALSTLCTHLYIELFVEKSEND